MEARFPEGGRKKGISSRLPQASPYTYSLKLLFSWLVFQKSYTMVWIMHRIITALTLQVREYDEVIAFFVIAPLGGGKR